MNVVTQDENIVEQTTRFPSNLFMRGSDKTKHARQGGIFLCLLKSIMQEMAVEISNIDIISQLGG
jgi:hypothetical protein